MSGETKFSVMVSLFEWIQKTKHSAKKRSKFRKFLDTFCKPDELFTSIRLILPSLDRERGSYGLKESVLATCLVDALGMSRESPDALLLELPLVTNDAYETHTSIYYLCKKELQKHLN
ncbi:DNA ligase 4 [Euphorbia peplus]|nr:DNA ligase 4 [Euphorbia peplus]